MCGYISRRIFIRIRFMTLACNGNDVYYVMRNGKAGRSGENYPIDYVIRLRQRRSAAKCSRCLEGEGKKKQGSEEAETRKSKLLRLSSMRCRNRSIDRWPPVDDFPWMICPWQILHDYDNGDDDRISRGSRSKLATLHLHVSPRT